MNCHVVDGRASRDDLMTCSAYYFSCQVKVDKRHYRLGYKPCTGVLGRRLWRWSSTHLWVLNLQ